MYLKCKGGGHVNLKSQTKKANNYKNSRHISDVNDMCKKGWCRSLTSATEDTSAMVLKAVHTRFPSQVYTGILKQLSGNVTCHVCCMQ
jgi:hypothetical protein